VRLFQTARNPKGGEEAAQGRTVARHDGREATGVVRVII
jgi:hypothetical protein